MHKVCLISLCKLKRYDSTYTQQNECILYLIISVTCQIFVNGKPLTKYRVRGSIEDIKAVNVSGKVFILETLLMKRLVPFSLSLSFFFSLSLSFLMLNHSTKVSQYTSLGQACYAAVTRRNSVGELGYPTGNSKKELETVN